MKRILLGTTMLIGAASLAAAANAETPKITLGGVADFQFGAATGQDLNEPTTRGTAFRSDTEVTLNVDGKTNSGLGYGAFISLEADTTADPRQTSGANANRTYLYVDSKNWGRVQMGSDLGVTNTMKVDASSIARATGGIDGSFTYFMQTGAAAEGTHVIATPDLILDYGYNGLGTSPVLGDETTENANKISYYTPRFMGFGAGVSYIVDSDNKGQTVGLASNTDGEAENIITAAVNWQGKFSNVGIELGATMERGEAQNSAAAQDLRTWQAGGKLSYMGFSVAGSYADWDDSLRTASTLDDNSFWTLGAAYETGPFGISVTWLDSTYEGTSTVDNEFSNLSVGADYKLAPGFTPYAEVSFIDMDATGATTTNDNKTTVFIVGSALAF